MLSVFTTKTKMGKKGHEETFGGNGHIYCLDCGDVFIGVDIFPNSSNCKH